jgi:hypothetical protein
VRHTHFSKADKWNKQRISGMKRPLAEPELSDVGLETPHCLLGVLPSFHCITRLSSDESNGWHLLGCGITHGINPRDGIPALAGSDEFSTLSSHDSDALRLCSRFYQGKSGKPAFASQKSY